MNKKTKTTIAIIVVIAIVVIVYLIIPTDTEQCQQLISPNENILLTLCGNFEVSFYGANNNCTFWAVDDSTYNICNNGVVVR